MNSFHAPSILLSTSSASLVLFFELNNWAMRDASYNELGEVILAVNPAIVEKGALLTIFAKLSAMTGTCLFCLLLFSGRLFFLPSFLSNYVFRIITRCMFVTSLLMPVVARSHLGSFDTSIILTPLFSFYISLFSVILSTIIAIAFAIFIELPLSDFFKLLWFHRRIIKNKPDKS